MKDSDIIALAIDTCLKLNPQSVSPLNSQGDFITMTPEEIVAFANAIAKVQKEKDAQIFTGEPSESWMGRDIAEAIRSPDQVQIMVDPNDPRN